MRLSYDALLGLIQKQLGSVMVLDEQSDPSLLDQALPEALIRSKHCFSYCRNKYYRKDGEVYFSPFHSGQYCIFLYFLSHGIGHKVGGSDLADRLYYLNKIMNSVDMYHAVNLPDVFYLDHPLGSVMGRAKYANYFMFTQNCTVGNNRGVYPEFGENVTLLSGSKVLGDCLIGSNVILASNTFVIDESIPDNSIVFGSSPHLIIKNRDPKHFTEEISRWFRDMEISIERRERMFLNDSKEC